MIVNDTNAPPEEFKMPPVPAKDAPVQRPLVEAPPPYSPAAGPSTLHSPPSPVARQSSTPASVLRPQTAQTVNHFELFTKHDSLSGTYLIDPLLPSPPLAKCRRRGRKRDNVWGKSSRPVDINASFRTRHGAISLDLEVVAQTPSARAEKVPARIVAGTKHGRVTVDVHSVHPSRSLDLFVESKHGRMVLMLPPTFDGPLVFKTRHCNSVSFLPEFAARMRTMRATDSETVVLCSAPGSQSFEKPLKPINQMADDTGDRCLVRTQHGKIIVGISGLDRLEETAPGGGFFKAIGKLFESHGKAIGQYVESQARTWEKAATGRSAMISQYVDTQMEAAHNTAMRAAMPRLSQSSQPSQLPQPPQMPQLPQSPQMPGIPQPPSPPQPPLPPRMHGGITASRGGLYMDPDTSKRM
ncbi:hypothetical protein C8T65DRAFT_670359 [Cerioporus squamosus]|nr:hypothetical protein C8T65DRAFT_670359 [Cerioporus squamosus]